MTFRQRGHGGSSVANREDLYRLRDRVLVRSGILTVPVRGSDAALTERSQDARWRWRSKGWSTVRTPVLVINQWLGAALTV